MIYNDILYRKLPFLVSKITPIPLSPGCRAVELSRLRRAAVEAVVEALPVEPVEFGSPLTSELGCDEAGLRLCRTHWATL